MNLSLIEGSCVQDGDALAFKFWPTFWPTDSSPVPLAVLFSSQTVIYEHHSSGSFDWVSNWFMSPWDSNDGSFVFLRARSFTNWLLVFMMANSPPLRFVKSCCWRWELWSVLVVSADSWALEPWFLATMWGAFVQLGNKTAMSAHEIKWKAQFSVTWKCAERFTPGEILGLGIDGGHCAADSLLVGMKWAARELLMWPTDYRESGSGCHSPWHTRFSFW